MAAKKKAGSSRTVKSTSVEINKKTELNFAVSSAQAKAIQECLKKGALQITLSDVDLEKTGKFKGAYIYD